MKKLIAYIMTAALLLSGVQGIMPAAYAAGGGTEEFRSSFEKTDPALNMALEKASGVSAIELKTESLAGEFYNYAPTNPVTVNRELKCGSSETPDMIIDDDISTKLCATGGVEFPLEFTFTFAQPITPNAYYITGAGDDISYDDRVLSEWKVLGSNTNNGSDWVELDAQTAVEWTENNQVKNFEFAKKNETAYQYIKLSVTKRGNDPTTNGGLVQFSGFGLGTGIATSGSGGTVANLYTAVAPGPSYNWGARAGAWDGKSTLHVSGTTTAADSKSYTVLYDNLDIEVKEDTKLSYMVFPDIGTNYDVRYTAENYNYDFEYTSMYAAVDLEFSDGTRLSEDYKALDQYQNVVSPLAQGQSKVMCTNNWLNITSTLSSDSKLVGKHISKILVGFEKTGGTVGKDVSTYFDDIRIYREADPVVTNLADYVNILRGSYTSGNNPARGINAALVATPNPFNFWAPTTIYGNTSYFYNGTEANFKGVKIGHVASNWIGESGVYYFSADSTSTYKDANTVKSAVTDKGSTFNHENEVAKPYYYGVTFNEADKKAPGVKIEVTPTVHAGILRFTFPKGSEKCNIIFDPHDNVGDSKMTYVSGEKTFLTNSGMRTNGQETLDIYGEFSVAPKAWHSANDGSRGIFEFAPADSGDTVIEMKVATSYMNPDQAKKNLGLEIGADQHFDDIKAEALALWNDTLKVIEVKECGTHDQLVTLYSNLYRANIYPMNLAENTGTAEEPRMQYTSPYPTNKNGDQNKIVDGQLLYNNGFWDTYRTAWPLYSILTPEKSTFLLDGLVQHYVDQGWVPRWIAPGGTNSMVGTNSDNIFADALSRGIDFNVEAAYLSAVRNGSVYSVNNQNNSYSGRSGLERSPFIGYYANDNDSADNLSWTLEGYVTDFGIATMAKILRDNVTDKNSEEWREYNDQYLYFTSRSKSYAGVFNPSGEGWFRAKKPDGTWLQSDKDFDPISMGYGYCEDNAYGYAFHMTQDGQGLANLYGAARGIDGRTALGDKLDEAFTADGTADPGAWGGHKENWEGRECKQGQVHLDNQPAHHIPYMYLYTDRPWKTAETVRDALDRLYTGENIGQGYIGDDDNGESSSWYILSALGLYPLTNGNGYTAIGTPLFEKVVINRDDGTTVTISAPGVSRENKYVQSVQVNGAAHSSTVLAPELFKGNLTIDFTMGSTPSKTWGMDDNDMPPSLTEGKGRPETLKDLTVPGDPVAAVEDLGGDADGYFTNGEHPAAMFNDRSMTNTAAEQYTYWAADETNFVTYYFEKPLAVQMYTITSWNAENAPIDWTFSGSNDGTTWTALDTRTGQDFGWEINPTEGGDKYTRPFAIADEKQDSYQYYKLEFTKWTKEIRVSELELLGDEFAAVDKAALLEVIEQAKALDEKAYGPESWEALTEAVVAAQAVYDNADALPEEIAAEIGNLEQAMSDLVLVRRAWEMIEGVDCDEATPGIKKESTGNVSGAGLSGTVTNLGGIGNGAYIAYQYVDFGAGGYTKAKLIYSGKNADLNDSSATFYLENKEDPEAPIKIASFTGITGTGPNWDIFKELTVSLEELDISGMQKLYVEFAGKGQSIMNLHAISFVCDTEYAVTSTMEAEKITGEIPSTVKQNMPISFTLTPKKGWGLPETITVTMGGVALTDGEDYTYSSTTGKVRIPDVTGDVAITVEAVERIIPITGVVTIDGEATYGKTLKANVSEVLPVDADLSYAWTGGSKEITADSYELDEGDIGKIITLTVSGELPGYKGTISDTTEAVSKAPQAAPEGVKTTPQTGEGTKDGAITDVTTEMEYKAEGDSDDKWQPCKGTEVTQLLPGKYQVRFAETTTHSAGEFVTVEVLAYKAPPKAETPNAAFEASDMTLSNVEAGMQYSLDGGKTWIEIKGETAVLAEDQVTAAKGIQVYQPGDNETTSDSEVQVINLTQAEKPTVGKTDETAEAKGAITGVDSTMQYMGADEIWHNITGETVEVEPGVYEVRVKGAGTVLASASAEVTVGAYVPLDKTAIEEAIAAAEAARKDVIISDAAADEVPKGTKFVSAKVMAVLDAEIEAARDAAKAAETEQDVADAAKALKTAISAFKDAIQKGTYEEPYEPSYNPPSNTTTKTEKNEDGSTTKTVTNKKTGDVTATTTYPDGTKLVATTPKDGETSIAVTVPKDKENVIVTIPTAAEPKPGEVAVIVHEGGTKEILKASIATEDGMKVLLSESCKLEIMDNSKSFADVASDHWAAEAVTFVTSRELFNGGDGGFQPAGDMSRGMLFTVLARLDGQDTEGGETWYSAAMDWAKESGISDGTAPEANITRESLAVMLYRYAGSPAVDGARRDEVIAPYGDADSVSDWATDAMLWCVDSGILQGSDNKLNPDGTATRAEVAIMLQRFISNMA